MSLKVSKLHTSFEKYGLITFFSVNELTTDNLKKIYSFFKQQNFFVLKVKKTQLVFELKNKIDLTNLKLIKNFSFGFIIIVCSNDLNNFFYLHDNIPLINKSLNINYLGCLKDNFLIQETDLKLLIKDDAKNFLTTSKYITKEKKSIFFLSLLIIKLYKQRLTEFLKIVNYLFEKKLIETLFNNGNIKSTTT